MVPTEFEENMPVGFEVQMNITYVPHVLGVQKDFIDVSGHTKMFIYIYIHIYIIYIIYII
jgi:hypothetical protein